MRGVLSTTPLKEGKCDVLCDGTGTGLAGWLHAWCKGAFVKVMHRSRDVGEAHEDAEQQHLETQQSRIPVNLCVLFVVHFAGCTQITQVSV